VAREASLQESLIASFEQQMAGIYTAIPAIVVTVIDDLHQQTVDVQPTVNIRYKSGVVSERPPILNVPLIFPCSRTSAFTFPVNKGDIVYLVFSMRGLDSFKAGDGRPTSPLDYRKYDQRDAVAIPGLLPTAKSINNPANRTWSHDTSDTVVAHNLGTANEVEIRLKADGDVVINTSKKVQINCNEADVVASTSISLTAPILNIDANTTNWIGNINLNGGITQTGNYTSTGTFTFNGIVFDSHVHGTSPGPSNP
jgi:phage baseplate assembly protein gpV